MLPRSLMRLLRRVLIFTLHFALLVTLLGLTPTPSTRADNKAPTTGELQLVQVEGAAGVTPTPKGGVTVAPQGQNFLNETEPNGTRATANAVPGVSAVIAGNIYPNADEDFYAFTASAGDRVYAAVMTNFSPGSTDSNIEIQDAVGTVLEVDNDDGSFSSTSSSIAGTLIPVSGTYYIRMRSNSPTGQIRPYALYVRVQSGAPVAETEPNNTTVTANPLPASGWVTGTIDPVADVDFFTVTLTAGDSVYLALDLDPERDVTTWNGRVGLGLFGNPPANQILVVNDASVTSPNSEAFFITVKDSGIYYAYVDPSTAGAGNPSFTYHLSLAVFPAAVPAGACTTYTSADTPVVIPTGPGVVASTITIPGNPIIADLDVTLNITHTFMQDLDAALTSPANNTNSIFTDIGGATVGGAQTYMDLVLDDEAALPSAYALTAPMNNRPEAAYRLSWFDGEKAGGAWTLTLRDDATGDGGTLNSWSIRVCEPPPPPLACTGGTTLTTLFSSDFEAGDGGFTHSGTADEWARGLPSVVPITTCNSGTNCWKTDLTGTYNVSSSQNLFSPAIPLTVTGLVGPIYISWAQRYQMESATFDHAFVDVQQVGGATPTRLWEWLDGTMSDSVGNPTTTLQESSGWSVYTRTISSYLGQNIEAVFHLDSDTSGQFGGLAIDDVSVAGCVAVPNLPPTANAGVDQTVNVSATVTLDGSGSNDPDNNLPLTYGWTQSGGPAVTLSDPTVVTPTFTAPATPTVLTFTLTVTDSLAAPSLPDSVVITVTDVAISGLTASNDSPTALGYATTLSATLSAGTNVNYDWDFSDGLLGSGATLTHTYSLAGSYTATVTATNSLGSVNATTLVTVIAGNLPPIANSGNDQTADVSATVTLDGSGSNDPDNNLPLTYGWEQSGGPAVTLSDPTVVTPTFTAPATPTVLTFTLTVTDSLNAPSLPDSVVITITDVAISGLTASNDSPTTLGNATTLSATLSAGTNVTYDWDFGDGLLGSGATLTHTYGLVGTYTATVTATNSLGSVSATTSVTITDVAISGLTASNDSPTVLGNATSLSATISAGTNVTYDWDFGDGLLGSGATLTHTYSLAGTYTATVTATNGLGSVNATTLVTITAANTLPTISDTSNQTMTLGSPLTFTITISDAETPAASLVVTGVSANQSIVPNANIVVSGSGLTRTVTITPLITGTVTITLTVDDGNGGTASDDFDLTVQPAAPVVFRLYLPILRR